LLQDQQIVVTPSSHCRDNHLSFLVLGRRVEQLFDWLNSSGMQPDADRSTIAISGVVFDSLAIK